MSQHGDYLYHGSNQFLTELKPHQAQNVDQATGLNGSDGPPGVAASDGYQIPIFRALINRHIDTAKGQIHLSQFDQDGDGPVAYAALEHSITAARADDALGYVYVFDRADFEPFRGHEYRSDHAVAPKFMIKVTGRDLPGDIRVIDQSELPS